MTDNIKIVVSPDEAECIYRALNYYVEAFEMQGGAMIVNFTELVDLAKQDPHEFGAGDRVAQHEEDLARNFLKVLTNLVFSKPKYDPYGQRMTDCCGGFSTYGPDVNLDNLDSVPMKCAVCGRLTTKGEGDQTEFEDGVTPEIWYARLKAHEALAQEEG